MSKEVDGYREHLEAITARFGEVLFIPLKEASTYININDRRLKSDKTFPSKRIDGRYYVSRINLARWAARYS